MTSLSDKVLGSYFDYRIWLTSLCSLLFSSILFFALHRLQHTRVPCPSLTPRVFSNSCPLTQGCHPTISSSGAPFSSLSFPPWESFPMGWLFTSGGQNTGALASTSVLPVSIQGWFPSRLTGLISMLSKGLRSLLQQHSSKASILWCSAFLSFQLSHLYMITGKTIQIFAGKVMSLLFNILSRFVIAFLPRSNSLLISWLQSPSTAVGKGKQFSFCPFLCLFFK